MWFPRWQFVIFRPAIAPSEAGRQSGSCASCSGLAAVEGLLLHECLLVFSVPTLAVLRALFCTCLPLQVVLVVKLCKNSACLLGIAYPGDLGMG